MATDFEEVDRLVHRTVIQNEHASRLYLGPFQSIASITAIPISPITLLIGPNSAGKSAVLDALTLLANGLTLKSPSKRSGIAEEQFHILERSRRDVNQGELEAVVGFGSTATRKWIDDHLISANLVGRLGIAGDLGFQDRAYALDVVVRIRWKKRPFSEVSIRQYLDGLPLITIGPDGYYLHTSHPWLKEDSSAPLRERVASLTGDSVAKADIEQIYLMDEAEGFPLQTLAHQIEGESAYAEIKESLFDIGLSIPHLLGFSLSRTRSLGPWRQVPESKDLTMEFVQSGVLGYSNLHRDESWRGGLAAWELLARAALKESKAADAPNLLNTVNHWLSSKERFDCRLSVVAEVDDYVYTRRKSSTGAGTAPKAQSGARVTLRLVNMQGVRLLPEQVGSGISQLIPVVVASEMPGDFVYLEQPELHLHPRAQATLGDLFLERKLSGALIVETHSELLVLRILRRLREQAPKFDANPFPDALHSQVVAYYFLPSDDGTSTSVHRIRISSDGRFLDEWPAGFFAEGDDEILRIFDADDTAT